MTDTAKRQPRRSRYITEMIENYGDLPAIRKVQRALEDCDVNKAIRLALGL